MVVAFCILAFSIEASPLGLWGMSRVLGTYKMIAGDSPHDRMSVPEVRGLQGWRLLTHPVVAPLSDKVSLDPVLISQRNGTFFKIIFK